MDYLSYLEPVFTFLETWFLLSFLLLEFLAKLILNPPHQLGIVEAHSEVDKISSRQRGAALSVAGLVFAGLAIVFSNNPEQLVQQVKVFTGSFGLLLIAAFAHELTRTRRMVLTFQELALEYGLLLMVYGLFLLVAEFVPAAELTMLVVFCSVLVFRFFSVKGELEAHKNKFDSDDHGSRREYFAERVFKSQD